MKASILGSVNRSGEIYFAAYETDHNLVEFTVIDAPAAKGFRGLIGKGFRKIDISGIKRLIRVKWEPVVR